MPYTYDKKDNNSLMKTGDYEVEIEKMEIRTLPSGKEKLSIQYRVRSDVEQEYSNRCIFEDIWKEKESPEHFNRKRINQLLGTQDVKDGTVFEDINDIINYMVGSYLKVHVITEFNSYFGEDVNLVSYYRTSTHPKQTIGGAEDKKDFVISDDDLPF